MKNNDQSNQKPDKEKALTNQIIRRKNLVSRVTLKSSEINITFEEINMTSQEIIMQAEKIGINLGVTTNELDALRAISPQLRRWLSENPSRRHQFANNPREALDTFKGNPSRSGRSHRKASQVRWLGLTNRVLLETAGAELADWALGAPGRLAILIKDPKTAVDKALVTQPLSERKKMLERISITITESNKRVKVDQEGLTDGTTD